jgi:hypothetical protein
MEYYFAYWGYVLISVLFEAWQFYRFLPGLSVLLAGYDEDYVSLYLFSFWYASCFSSYIRLVPEVGGFLPNLGSIFYLWVSYPLKSHAKMEFQCGALRMLSIADGYHIHALTMGYLEFIPL